MAERHRLELPGETRFATLDAGRLVAMAVRRAGDGVAAGEVHAARVVAPGRVTIGAQDALIAPWPAGLTQGARLAVRIVRAAIPERGRLKPARGVPAGDAAGDPPPPPVRDDWSAELADQWDAAWAAAELGRVGFAGGVLILTPTPAHLAVDVDGDGGGDGGMALATAAAIALTGTLRLYGVGGSVVADLPALPDKAARVAVAAAFDRAAGGLAFERTAINGFGLMQVVLPRVAPSIIERAWHQRPATAALALLAAAGRDPRPGALRLVLEPDAARWLDAHPALLAELAARLGRPVACAPRVGVRGGHVESA